MASKFHTLRGIVAGPLLVLGLSAAIGVTSAASQGVPPTYEDLVKEGTVIAEKLCSSCHLMDGAKAATVNAGLPSFRGIANSAGQTATRIRNVLILPHATMPDVKLSNPEIDRLLAYIDSLRADSAGAPLVPRHSPGGKPLYPDPS